ncbi:transcriptional regulator, AraC family [Fodinibius roseus]|uniref:Transcriptional regulator, AraC family n=1 Tax=Fodinibius roseus TaxID=1194090 RepID=A0A1M4YY27_9BACT|nr:helix-turn-helix transcriptional regulator [Fodinibius roseus]SHF10598.1 transcriptional regulator, AraC family [Fodinibius roseus]
MNFLPEVMMRETNEIPLISRENYQKRYYKNEESRVGPISLQHFAIDCRSKLRDTIEPHRLNFYQMFIVTGGEGVQTFGINRHYLRENMLCFVSPDMITSWQSEVDKHDGYICSFSSDFFNLGREDKRLLKELPFFRIDCGSVLHLTDEQTQDYLSLFESMYQELNHHSTISEDILRSSLQLLLHKAHALYENNECEVVQAVNKTELRLMKSFQELYLKDFDPLKEHQPVSIKKVAEYADDLGVTQNHLNDTVKSVTGKSAGRLIKDQLIKQATMYLKQSSLDISEIAFRLGYEDPSYFSRYFKKHTGRTPSSVR